MAAKARVKDPESARAMEADLLEANEYLELNAALGMAAMLLVSMMRLCQNGTMQDLQKPLSAADLPAIQSADELACAYDVLLLVISLSALTGPFCQC